jgi:acetyltransferase-like isoleucine patch superfamily enzyme
MCRATALLEYGVIYALGSALGPSIVVRYLRNPNPRVAVKLLRAFGAAVGKNTTIKGGVVIDNVERDENSSGDFSHLTIGDNCYIGEGVFFDLAGEIHIDNDAVIAGNASFITHAECRRSRYLSLRFPRKCEPIVVGAGAWVGFGATVLAGVTIGRNSAIGAGSVVVESSEPEYLYVGSPARMLRKVE